MSEIAIRNRFKDAPMSRFQIAAAVFCAIAIITDGYDTVSMSLAAPFILKDLGLGPKALGVVFSSVALGMVAGAIIGSLADKVGRRTVILSGSAAAGVLMLLTGLANGTTEFLVLRFLTGCAVGSMVTCLNVIVLEYSSRKASGFFLALVHVGIGTGAIVGSTVAVLTIEPLGWRWIFFVGSFFNALVVVAGYFMMPESIEFLLARRPANALSRINRTLELFGKQIETDLPDPVATNPDQKASLRTFLSPLLLATTLLLAVASFAHFLVAYFQNSWAPKLLMDAGLDAQTALSGGIVAGVGSLIGNLGSGVLCSRYNPRYVTAGAFVLGGVGLVAFGFAHGHAAVLLGSAAVVSMFSSATNTGVYLSAARSYPAALRSTGVGLVVALGRIGAVIGPTLGGSLIALGWSRSSYYPIFAGLYLAGGLAIALSARFLVAARNE